MNLRRARDLVDEAPASEVHPVINSYQERAEHPWPLIQKLAKLGVTDEGINGYGRPGPGRDTHAVAPRGAGPRDRRVGGRRGLLPAAVAVRASPWYLSVPG
jgi:hypothetical protein